MTLKNNFKSQGTVLILEKALEASGQPVENLNFLEHFLITTVERVGRKSPLFKSKFLLRRLPSYAGAFGNANEYGVVLEAFPFLLNSPMKNWHGSTFDKHGSPGYGQIEIFSPNKTETKANENLNEFTIEHEREELINEKRAYKSHELFVKFAGLFIEAANEVKSGEADEERGNREEIQPLGSHLLIDIKCENDINKMIILKQNEIPLNKKMRGKVQVKLNSSNSFIQVRVGDTKVTLRPTLFYPKGYFKVNSNILERIPLFHRSIINITDALKKGCLLFPTKFETVWTLGFWPSESHLVSLYHPSSIVSRVFKIYTAFCLNPYAVWEALNSTFLIGIPDETLGLGIDMDTLSNNSFSQSSTCLSFDFLFSSFLFHLEKYEEVTDWSPINYQKRLLQLLNTTVDAQEKGYHSHYFTRTNVLRGTLKGETLNRKTVSTSSGSLPRTPETRRQSEIEEDSDDGDFGLRFENLAVRGDEEFSPETIYKCMNPNPIPSFESGDSSRRESKEKRNSKPKSLSRIFGTKSKKSRATRSASVLEGREKSMTDIVNDFEEVIAELRKEEKMKQFSSPIEFAETSFSSRAKHREDLSSGSNIGYKARNSISSGENSCRNKNIITNVENSNFTDMFEGEKWDESEDTVYRNIIQVISESPFPDTFGDPELVHEFDKTIRVLSSQAELISAWTEIMSQDGSEKFDFICPHAFNSRQIEYISIVIQKMSQCSPISVRRVGGIGSGNVNDQKMPSWEMCGDILRTVLHQMRSDLVFNNLNHVERIEPKKKFSFKIRNTMSLNEGVPGPSGRGFGTGIKRRLSKGFSFNLRRPADICKSHGTATSQRPFGEDDNENFALDDPETAATHRLLEWLWQLKNSGIGRLSQKAELYIQQLFWTSHVNSYFLEQFTEEKIFHTMAMRSAVAVSQIMSDVKFPAYVPLLAASKKGWVWAEMALSLANWNGEKGSLVKGLVKGETEIERDLQFPLHFSKEMTNKCVDSLGRKNFSSNRINSFKWEETEELDTEAITLAFHSETSTPLGWNDFEDPRRPGPFTIPILILSPGNYFNRWEMIPGNIVHVMIRLQKFNVLQNIGSMLFVPHRKVALGEIRKLNKSHSFPPHEFDDNVMSKTFKRLASMRTTKNFLNTIGYKRDERRLNKRCYTCDEVGCEDGSKTTITNFRGQEVECTKL